MIFHISDKTQFLHLAGLIQLVTAQGCGCVAPWVNTEENTESQTQTLFPKIPFIWEDQEKAKILFLFCIRVGRSRLDCRVGFSGQLEAHFYSVKEADRTVIYVIFDFQVISGNREKREEDRTISVGLISLNSSVTGLSFLSAKLSLKSKDKCFLFSQEAYRWHKPFIRLPVGIHGWCSEMEPSGLQISSTGKNPFL